VTIRLKFLNETERDVEASLVENIRSFKRRHFNQEMSANKIVRLIFNGKVLREEEQSLQSYGLFDKCVVHCLIHQQQQQQQQHQQQQQVRILIISCNVNFFYIPVY
jgi:transmembrane and ubiquitin-like domain-containing protein